MVERLETDRLILRMFRDSDLEAYAEMCGDPEVMKYLGGVPMTRSEAWRSMATVLGHWQLRGFGLWAVEERERRARGPGRLLAAGGLAGPGGCLDAAPGVLGPGLCHRGGEGRARRGFRPARTAARHQHDRFRQRGLDPGRPAAANAA